MCTASWPQLLLGLTHCSCGLRGAPSNSSLTDRRAQVAVSQLMTAVPAQGAQVVWWH